ncbi:MAG: Uma2 family endonuclease, partial [Ferruginibacter sp.]|nr:Uma2 family endonuclease [Ferruginibacter sp.]
MKEYLTILNDDMTEKFVEEPQSEYGFTYADYLNWNFKERIELIKGKIFKMSPAPTIDHQRILGKIHLFLGTKLKRGPCEIFVAPVNVKLIGEPFKKRKMKDDEI